MKQRNFYPRQVAKRLSGKHPASWSSGERAALRFFTTRGRKMGIGVLIARTDIADFKSAGKEEAEAILGNTNQRIIMSLR